MDDEIAAGMKNSWAGVGTLWVAALVVLTVIGGAAFLPPAIQLFGRGGQRETVEWLVYVFLGTIFPLAVAGVAWYGRGVSRLRLSRPPTIALVAFLLVSCVAFLAMAGTSAFLLAASLAMLTVVAANRLSQRRERSAASLAISVVLLAAVWQSALTLASWTRPWGWASQSMRTPIVLLLLGVCAVVTLFGKVDSDEPAGRNRFRLSWADAPVVLAFAYLSFRTAPIIEFYHWGFWVGPIESIRQGGWPLWDVPSQYGFVSVLLPSLLPVADAWQTLYLLQGILYLVVAVGIYAVLAGLRSGFAPRVLAAAFTAAAFFFRPRTAALILPAQMTPAGGPMRFFWCYAILAVLVWKYWRGDKVSPRRFALVGAVTWVASIAWSAESAIYCTVAWLAAFGVFVMQRAFADSATADDTRLDGPPAVVSGRKQVARRAAKYVAGGLALLAVTLGFAIAAVSLFYRAADGHGPDWASYYEYALLFSGGYSALPIDGYGPVWYLVILFAAASTAVVRFLILDPCHPRLFVAAGAWGTIWGVSSYFVSRSHPVNLLSLVPLLVVAFAIILHLTGGMGSVFWVRLVRLAAVPLICIPPALTLSHGGLVALLAEPQPRMSDLTRQVPAMDSSLAELAFEAGIKPTDPVFFASDGKYLFPRWPRLDNGVAETNELAWIPKPYEVIRTLPPDRRDAYIERFSRRVPSGGWLIQKKAEINPGYETVVRLIEQSYAPASSFDNDHWLIKRYERKSK